MNQKQVTDYILSLPQVERAEKADQPVLTFNVDKQMFALVEKNKKLVCISLRCDPQLSTILREHYNEVMPGHKLNQKLWNTIVLSGQLSWSDVQALIRHSYDLAKDEAKV